MGFVARDVLMIFPVAQDELAGLLGSEDSGCLRESDAQMPRGGLARTRLAWNEGP